MKKDAIRESIFFSFLAFLYFHTTNQIFSFDGVTNAIAAESNEPLRWFHPNHPLYPAMGVLFYRIHRWLGYQGLAIYSLSWINSLLAVAGLFLLLRALKSRVDSGLALITVVFLSFCYGVWAYAVDARAVGMAIFFACLVYASFLNAERRKNGPLSVWIKLGVFSGLYALCHGIAALHIPVLAVWIWKEKGGKNAAAYAAVSAGVIAIVVAGAFLGVVKPRTSADFMAWIQGYAGHSNVSYWSSSIRQAIVGQWDGWRHFFFFPVDPTLNKKILEGGLGVVTLVWLAASVRSVFRSPSSPAWALLGVSLAVALFLTVWSPGQEGFRIHMIIPAVLAGVLSFSSQRWTKGFLGLLSALLLAFNLNGPVGQAAEIKNNVGYQQLSLVRSHLAPGDVFLSAQSGFVPNSEVLLPYFFPEIGGGTMDGWFFAFRERNLDGLAERLKRKIQSGHRVYMGSDVLDPAVQSAVSTRWNLASGEFDKFIKNFDVRPAFELDPNKHVTELLAHR